MSKRKALIIMDFINEIVHPEGKFKGKGYANYVEQNNTIEHLGVAIAHARNNGFLVIFVRVGFSENYNEQPKNSLLFGKAHEFKALTLNTWATEIHSGIDVKTDDFLITKHRISPFFGTPLEIYLNNNGIDDVYLCGVSTDLVVESAARDSHDRGYNVYVVSDCCGAGSEDDHNKAISTISKISNICLSSDL